MLNVMRFVLLVLEVVILHLLIRPSLIRVDSGAYPRGGKLTLEAQLSPSLFSKHRMTRLSTDHC
jgi:hypothetical protein